MFHVKYRIISNFETKDSQLSSVKCELWRRQQQQAALSWTLQNEYDGA